MKIINQFFSDLANPMGARNVVYAMRGDCDSRAVQLTLTSNCTDWPVPAGVTASVAAKKPDNTHLWYNQMPDHSPSCTVAGSTITAELAPQFFTAAGTVTAAIVLQDANFNQLTTFPFTVVVSESPVEGAVSNDYYSVTNLAEINQKFDAIARRLDELEQGGTTGGGGLTPEQAAKLSEIDGKVSKTGHGANKYLGTNAEGDVVEKDITLDGGGLTAKQETLIIKIMRSATYSEDVSKLITELENSFRIAPAPSEETLDKILQVGGFPGSPAEPGGGWSIATESFGYYVCVYPKTISGGRLKFEWDTQKRDYFDYSIRCASALSTDQMTGPATNISDGSAEQPKGVQKWNKAGDHAITGNTKGGSPFYVDLQDGDYPYIILRRAGQGTSPDGTINTQAEHLDWLLNGGVTITITEKGAI